MEQTEDRKLIIPLAISLIVVTLWAISAVLIIRFISTWTDRSSFGDMFGAVNALFSGLALSGVTYAIFLQQRELKLQREELTATRVELERSAAAQERSEQALIKQVEAQNMAARLTALSSILSHYDSQATGGIGIGKHYGQTSAQDVVDEMKKLLDEIKVESNKVIKRP
ncbi:MAG: hypothetical protein QOD28_509 [Acidobacteriota bacterium]|nr:hypothetical protein [Acidobacteriota bacterium]